MASSKTAYLVRGIPGHIDDETASTKIELFFQNRLKNTEVEVESVKPLVSPDDTTYPRVFLVEFNDSIDAIQSILPSDSSDYEISIKDETIRLLLELCPQDAQQGTTQHGELDESMSSVTTTEDGGLSQQQRVRGNSSSRQEDEATGDQTDISLDTSYGSSSTLNGIESYTTDTMSTTSEYSHLSLSLNGDKRDGRRHDSQHALSVGKKSTNRRPQYNRTPSCPQTRSSSNQGDKAVFRSDLNDSEGTETTVGQDIPDETTIEVTGFDARTSMEHLKLYFTNKEISGGGKIVDGQMMDGSAHITFKHQRHADRVLDGRVHKIEGATLSVRKVTPSQRAPIDKTSFLLTGLPPGTKEAEYELTLYLENCTGKQNPILKYAEGFDKVMVTYPTEIDDFDKLMQTIDQKSFMNERLTCEAVRQPNCVIVSNLKEGTTETLLTLYFENKRSGGSEGQVERVVFDEENACALVYFRNYTDASKVLNRQHTLKEEEVTVQPFYDVLGRFATDSRTTDAGQAETATVLDVNPSIMEYIMENEPLKKALVQKLRDVNAEIRWPFDRKEKAQLHSINSLGTNNAKTWERAAVTAFHAYRNEFRSVEVKASQAVFDKVLQQTTAAAVGRGVKVTPRAATSEMVLCGKAKQVSEVKKDTETFIREVELWLEKERRQTSEEITLSPLQVKQLNILDFSNLAQRECANVKVIIDHEKNKVRIDGELDDTKHVKTMMYKFLADLKVKILSASPLAKFLGSENALGLITCILNDSGVLAVYDAQGGDITISAVNQSDLDKAADILNDNVKQKILNIPPESRSCLHGDGWQGHVNEVEEKFAVVVGYFANQPDRVNVTGLVDNVDRAVSDLKRYIDGNTAVDRFIRVASGKVEFMFKHMKSALDDLAETGIAVEEKKHKDTDGPGVIIHGTKENIDNGETRIKEYLNAIKHDRRSMEQPGLARLFQHERGRAYIRLVEEDHGCVIAVSVTQSPDGRTGLKEEIQPSQKLQSRLTIVCQVQLSLGRRVVVMKGDITKMRVDAIVNPANNKLDHGGGLAKAIVDAGGDVIQEESDRIIKKYGNLVDGQAVSTGPGRLQCKRVIHAVGPRWDIMNGGNFESRCVKKKLLLADAVSQSLKEAERCNCTSVAVPAISSGVFGFPLDLCTEIIVEAVRIYNLEHQNERLLDVFLIDVSDSVCNMFKGALEKYCGQSNVCIPGQDQNRRGSATRPGHKSSHPQQSKSSLNRHEIATAEGKVIRLVKGSITRQTTDVIVNTTGKNMELQSGGAVSQAILREGGVGIQREMDCKTRQRGTPDVGQLLLTGSGNLRCKAIYHAFCGPWTAGKDGSEKVVRHIMRESFKVACKTSLKSITFPAIGTGGHGYPRERVADVMLEEALNFSKRYSHSSLTDIHIIVYDKDYPTILAFQDRFVGHQSHSKPQSQSREFHGYFKDHRGHFPYKDHRIKQLKQASSGDVSLEIGNVNVELVQGDICKQSADVMVNCTSNNLTYERGVSKAIVEAAGQEVKDELIKIEKQRVGSVVLTSAGRLNCKKIIHLVPDPDNMKDSVQAVLKLADLCRYSTVVMPTVGTGSLRKHPREIAKKIFGSIEDSPKLETVNKVRIVIYQQDMMDVFKKAMEEFCEPSFTRSVKRTMRKFFSGKTRDMAPKLHQRETNTHEERQQSLPVVWFDIFSGSENDIKSAFDKLNKCVEREIIEKVVEDNDVGSLTDDEVTELKKQAESLQARVEEINTGRVFRLKLKGTPEAVMELNDKVTEFLKRVQEEHRREAAATALAKNVAWLYWNEDGFEEYEDEVAGYIEQEYKAGNEDVFFELDDSSYQVCFDSMTEVDLSDGSKVPVRRDLKEGGISLPKHWTTMNDSEGVKQVPLIRSSEEYIRIADGFKKSMLPTVTEIVQIRRIQNKQLYRQVMLKRQAMEHKSKPGITIERNLYHGTASETCTKINAQGFNRSFAGKHAAAYGRGCYFALSANYSSSDTFSPRDANGQKHMYLCKVLTGEYTTGRREMLVPPSKNPNNPTDYYDSVVDNTANPTIFVIFNDAMAYPEYLITFK
ncbi:protein mono-ADP-ribosyltransferase PARP14-like [Ptychodera flava]|uniref:protein mono-ADP-ribosyltransferase PARP14-like n=1 Tax=Ptychodera flava TaxID=63121 RepID=UPI00396A5C9D